MSDRVGFERVNETVVAFYGENKPGRLADFVVMLHERLASRLGRAFTPYTLEQVHATLVGLEGERSLVTGEIFNRNYAERRGEQRIMNVEGALTRIMTSPAFPLPVRIGGFAPDVDYSCGGGARRTVFMSRGHHPYRRAFSMQGKAVVAMGWPWTDGVVSTALARLRKALESEGVLHKYHEKLEDSDNDFFFVLGRVERSRVDGATIDAVEEEIRELMAGSTLELLVDLEDMKRVSYVDPSLPFDSSLQITLPNHYRSGIGAYK
jgi:hypothetical protein